MPSATRPASARVRTGRSFQTRGARGERGERGPNGERGPAGPAAPTIVGWQIDRASFTATPIMSDGSEGPPLELRGLFEQYQIETG